MWREGQDGLTCLVCKGGKSDKGWGQRRGDNCANLLLHVPLVWKSLHSCCGPRSWPALCAHFDLSRSFLAFDVPCLWNMWSISTRRSQQDTLVCPLSIPSSKNSHIKWKSWMKVTINDFQLFSSNNTCIFWNVSNIVQPVACSCNHRTTYSSLLAQEVADITCLFAQLLSGTTTFCPCWKLLPVNVWRSC